MHHIGNSVALLLIVEDEIVTVYDADSHVVAKSETITLPLDSE